VEMHRPEVEIVSVVQPGKVDLGAMDIAVVSVEPVGVGEILVSLEKNIPAEVPAGVDGKLALRAHHAAKLVRVVGRAAVDGVGTKCCRVVLVDAGYLEAVLAIVEALPPVGLTQETLLR